MASDRHKAGQDIIYWNWNVRIDWSSRSSVEMEHPKSMIDDVMGSSARWWYHEIGRYWRNDRKWIWPQKVNITSHITAGHLLEALRWIPCTWRGPKLRCINWDIHFRDWNRWYWLCRIFQSQDIFSFSVNKQISCSLILNDTMIPHLVSRCFMLFIVLVHQDANTFSRSPMFSYKTVNSTLGTSIEKSSALKLLMARIWMRISLQLSIRKLWTIDCMT